MKIRKFYPRQVLRALEGKEVQKIDDGQRKALVYFLKRSRKMKQEILILNDVKISDFAGSVNKETAEAILANATTKIYLKMPVTA